MADFEELGDVTLRSSDILLFGSREFRIIRFFLRLLSLWRPQSAGFFESYVYPAFVNLILLGVGIVRNSIQASEKDTLLSLQLVYAVHEVGVWFGHLLGNCYFSSRDLETNVLKPVKPLTGIRKPIARRLKVLSAAVILSTSFFSVMLCTLFVVTEFRWNKGGERFSAQLPNIHGPVDHILYGLVLLEIIYDLGIGLALAWTLALLFTCYAARLKMLEHMFLKWKHTSVDAISLFIRLYSRPVKSSWKRLSWWFLAHNVVALAIPLYGYELAQAVSGRAYHSKHLPQFVCYLFFIVTMWLAPIVMSEQIKRRERKFRERINNISPGLILEMGSCPMGESRSRSFDESGVYSLPATAANDVSHHGPSRNPAGSTCTEVSESDPTYAEYTFACRGKELRKFLRFLKHRTPGLVARGYSMQLNLSLISLIGGAISFISELHDSKNAMMYRQCNCTVS